MENTNTPVAWMFRVDPAYYSDKGYKVKLGKDKPENVIDCVPLYTCQVIQRKPWWSWFMRST